ncbi:YcaO-like family protein [Shimia thalassica]|uniref:YcaO-like family protein n=1 Tax=Shimia thalassica TaxID=1715693 RepID=UPI001C0848BA|nr:YcaO-like family protein [Shimia thalassica]MBU2941079.1 YcaO-like family protein [Shimia thalassica]MDO6503437.1 YcaO-like family protein [Shimia thalassica]
MSVTFIQNAETSKLISKPSFADFPDNAPIHAAFRLIELRKGTVSPPGAMARRVAFGVADTPEMAAQLSGFEAIERYALQYSADFEQTCQSLFSSDGIVHELSRGALALGAPETNGTISSKGAAAGSTLADAALRAVYECLEHALDGAGDYSHVASPECLPDSLVSWLAKHLRAFEIHVEPFPEIGLLVRVICSDFDGGRPCYGTAFAAELGQGALSAAGEAIVSWRNMVTLEHKGVTPQGMDAEETRFFELYRGARGDRPISPQTVFDVERWSPPAPEIAQTLDFAAKVLGAPVAVFDMTAADIPLPVVKAVPIAG